MMKTILIFYILYSQFVFAGTFKITGKVVDEKTRSPLIGANIIIPNTYIGTSTDLEGKFLLITKMPVESLLVSYIGYESKMIKLNSSSNLTNLLILLKEKPLKMSAVVVEVERYSKKPVISFHRLSLESIKNVPPLGEPDIFHSLNFVPGIQRVGDWKASLSFEGTAPYQSGFFLNNVRVYNPFHFFGINGSINPEFIQDVEVYSSGAPAKYGEITGGVVNVISRDFSKLKKLNLNISLLNASLYYQKSWNKLGVQFGIRKTYFDIISQFIEPIPYGNVDANFRMLLAPTKTSFLEVYVNSANDFFTQKPELSDNKSEKVSLSKFFNHLYSGDYNFGYVTTGVNLTKKIGNSTFNSTISYLRDFIDFNKFIQTKFDEFSFMLELKKPLYNSIQWSNGIFYNSIKEDYYWITGDKDIQDIFPPSIIAIDSQKTSWFGGVYSQVQMNKNRYIFSIGSRLTKYGNNIVFNPNFGIKFKLSQNHQISFQAGIYSQILASPFNIKELTIKSPYFIQKYPVRTIQLGAGYTTKLNDAKEIQLRIYTHHSRNLPYWDDISRQFFNNLKTSILGASIMFSDTKGLLTYQLFYDYNNGKGTLGNNKFPLDWNIEHSFKGIWGFKIAHGWYLNITTQFHSGTSYTPVLGIYQGLGEENRINWGPRFIYGKKNTNKFPNYYRTDFSIRKLYKRKNWQYVIYLQFINVFNRKNIMRVNWVDYYKNFREDSKNPQGVIRGYPMLPSIGVEFKF